MAEQRLRIAVSGYYGFGNTGDEAVLAGIVESFRLRSETPHAEFTVLSADPADTERRHCLRAVNRMDRAALASLFRNSDLVLSGGGSLLQDTTSLRSLLYYLWVVRKAVSCGAPVMFYAQGIGPLRRSISRTLTRIVADRVSRITVRDPASAELLRSIGVRRPPIELTADPAFALQPAPAERIDEILHSVGCAPDERMIGVAIRPWHQGADKEVLGAAARKIAEETGRRLFFIPMQPPGDTALARAVAGQVGERAVVVDRELSPAEAVGLIARLDLLLGMRLHALIFAVAMGVPVVGMEYDPKVTQLMEMAGQSGHSLSLDTLSPEGAAAAVGQALSAGDTLRSQLREHAAVLRERALINVDHALLAIGPRL